MLHGRMRYKCFYVLLASSLAIKVQRISDTASSQNNDVPMGGPPMDSAVIQQSIYNLALSQGSMQVAQANSKTAETIRQELVALTAGGGADENYEKIKDKVPTARAQALQVRYYATEAAMHRDHISQIAAHWQDIAPFAAHEAKMAVAGWIAGNAAEHATAVSKQNHSAERSDILADAVGAAAEPYHLALLRNQKFCTVTYEKAKSAQDSARKLATDAKQIALQAQQLQASGMGLDAQSSMTVASGMMAKSEEMRKWANKLYIQANSACAGIQGYVMQEVMAANNAAATTVINKPMKLPPLL